MEQHRAITPPKFMSSRKANKKSLKPQSPHGYPERRKLQPLIQENDNLRDKLESIFDYFGFNYEYGPVM